MISIWLFWAWFLFMLLQICIVIILIPTKHRLTALNLLWFLLGGLDAFLLGVLCGAS